MAIANHRGKQRNLSLNDAIAAVVSKPNLVGNVKDWTGATKHICRDRNQFFSYKTIKGKSAST